MQHEAIKKLDDGSSVKVSIKLIVDMRDPLYRFSVKTKAKGKRTWIAVVDTDSYEYRKLSMEDRRVYENNKNIEVVGADFLNKVLLETWNKVKPVEIQN